MSRAAVSEQREGVARLEPIIGGFAIRIQYLLQRVGFLPASFGIGATLVPNHRRRTHQETAGPVRVIQPLLAAVARLSKSRRYRSMG